VQRLFALLGGLLVASFFVLGFFADVERVSFHWPLSGYIALIPLLPALLDAWPRWLRAATWSLAAAGLVAFLGYYAAVSTPSIRAELADSKWYPSNFAGWDELAGAVRDARAQMPGDTRIVADNFKIGAELGFALGDARIMVLDHPLNRGHGRAPQLRLWGLEAAGAREVEQGPVLLVVGATDVKLSELLAHYQGLCARFGRLPPAQAVNIDHGGRRFLLMRFEHAAGGARPQGACVTPAIAHINEPQSGAVVERVFRVDGWAVKDGVGVREVRLTLDGEVVATAEYGQADAWVADFLRGRSTDPAHPHVAFSAEVDATALPAGDHWLGMEIEGADGSVETWSERRIRLR